MATAMDPDDARRAIYRTLKLKDILDILADQKGWSNSRADDADEWYRNFLWLSYLHGKRGVHAIYKDSDDLWHAHMVYTQRYRDFVVPVFGRFLEHTPITGRVTQTYVERFQLTMEWYEAEFGNSPLDVPLANFVSQCY